MNSPAGSAPGWSLSLNASGTQRALGNISPFYNAFFDETKPAWGGNATRLLDTPRFVQTYVHTRDKTPARGFVLSPATINDAFDFAALVPDEINRSDVQPPLQHTERSVNIFTSYRFSATASRFFKGARVGCGANYRSAPVSGCDAANNHAPIRGVTTLLVNLMLGKIFPTGHGESVDGQINLQNLLGAEAMIPFAASTLRRALWGRFLSIVVRASAAHGIRAVGSFLGFPRRSFVVSLSPAGHGIARRRRSLLRSRGDQGSGLIAA